MKTPQYHSQDNGILIITLRFFSIATLKPEFVHMLRSSGSVPAFSLQLTSASLPLAVSILTHASCIHADV